MIKKLLKQKNITIKSIILIKPHKNKDFFFNRKDKIELKDRPMYQSAKYKQLFTKQSEAKAIVAPKSH